MGGFLASSELLSNDVKNGFTITVGVLGSISTIIQSVLHSCEYATKKKMFEQAADEYDKLFTKLNFLYNSKTSGTGENLNVDSKLGEFEEEVLKIKTNCIYLPPLFIIEKWNKHNINKKKLVDVSVGHDCEQLFNNHTEKELCESSRLLGGDNCIHV